MIANYQALGNRAKNKAAKGKQGGAKARPAAP